jgi:O-antigen/teichoic acid export membrane protein
VTADEPAKETSLADVGAAPRCGLEEDVTLDADQKGIVARRVLSGAGIRLGGFLAERVIQFVRVIFFARMFSPADLGAATLTLMCVNLVTAVGNLGWAQSLIRFRESGRPLIDTAFSLALVLGLLLMAVILMGAPVVSQLFGTNLEGGLRVLAVMVLVTPLQLPAALWEKELQFGHPTIVQLLPTVAGLLVTVGLEWELGLGIWSLLIGYVAGFLVVAGYVWFAAPYRPQLRVVKGEVRPLLRFGTPLMLQGINSHVAARGDNLMVAAYFQPTQMAYYNIAWQLPMMISDASSIMERTLFPVYARLDDRGDSIRKLFCLSNKMWALTGSFFGFALVVYAEQIVELLYGPQWAPVVPMLRVMTVSFVIRFCSGYSYDNLALVRGRTAYLMRWGLANTLLMFTLCLLMIRQLGPIGGAWFWLVQALVMVPAVRIPLVLQELGSVEYLRHVWKPSLSGLAAALAGWLSLRRLADAAPNAVLMSIAGSMVVYAAVYVGILLAMDHDLPRDVRRVLALVRRPSTHGSQSR